MTASAHTRPEARTSLQADPWLGWCLVGFVVLRFPAVLLPLGPDESGFLIVARGWDPAPGSMYGAHWVDRSPVLLGVFRAADSVGGSYAPRVLAALLGLAMVVAAYRAGSLLAGTRAARTCALLTVALSGQPLLQMWAAKSESLGVPLVMLGCWAALEAAYTARPSRDLAYAAAAGLLGGLAVGMKQNLVGGILFAGVVLLLTRRVTGRSGRRTALLIVATAAGALVPVIAVVVWAVSVDVSLSSVGYAVLGFRSDALDVIGEESLAAPLARLRELSVLSVATGVVPCLALFAWQGRHVPARLRPVVMAVAVMTVVDILGLLGSGSYWYPYLFALLPEVVLAGGLLSALDTRAGSLLRPLVVLTCVSTLAFSVVFAIDHVPRAGHWPAADVGRAVGSVAEPRDTIVVLYGRADVVLASGLSAPYEYLWSLPMRTLDPELEDLRGLLAGPRPPAWVVIYNDIDSWGLNDDGRLGALLAQRYVDLGEVCGSTVLVLDELRDLRGAPVSSPGCETG